MLHDYGARGVSSQQSAALGGMAHLVNFNQSDTMPGILAAKRWYNAGASSNSGPNSEHAGFTAWGRDNEVDAIRNMLETYRDHGFALVLTDTYDHENCVKNILGGELKEKIQDFPGFVGARPDSGDIVQVTADTTEWLMDAFGYEVNSKASRSSRRSSESFRATASPSKACRRSQGAGAPRPGSRQRRLRHGRRPAAALDRDTNNFAQKANAVCVNGEWRDIAKAPTGADFKVSKAGRLALSPRTASTRPCRRARSPEREPAQARVPQRQTAQEVGLLRADLRE